MLQNLKNQRILEPKFIDRVLTCPDCGSPEVYSKYACPKCDSYNVDYTELIEHMKCGYIGSKDKFMQGSSLVCPGCQLKFMEEIKDIALLQIGSCYQCEKCGQRFDKPEVIHFCQQCKRSFTHQKKQNTSKYTHTR